MFRGALFLLFVAAAPMAVAQTLGDIDKREAGVVEAWNATPLTVRKALFVSGHPEGFGQYAERAGNVFKPGEKLVAYAEPVGYGWKDIGDGKYEFGFKVDLAIKGADGKSLGEQHNFADLSEKGYARNREFFVLLTLTVSGLSAGEYAVEYTLHDIASAKSTMFTLPFKIAE